MDKSLPDGSLRQRGSVGVIVHTPADRDRRAVRELLVRWRLAQA